MPTPKHTEPVVLIIVTSIVVYSLITRRKKLSYLGKNWKHHIITPSMKALKMKSAVSREVKRANLS
ncbi:hypothetical protein [Flavobacterium sp.]